MGLAEKRAVETFKTEKLNHYQTKIKQHAGMEAEIDWTGIITALERGYSDLNAEIETYMRDIFFTPLETGLAAICVDDMGKSALKSGLKKIVLKNIDGSSSEMGITFEDGILTMNNSYSNSDQIKARSEAVQKRIEEKL